MKSIFKKEFFKAFTLAEVLITLAVIGTVAALTIPIVSGTASERAMEAGCKKAFNVYAEAMEMVTVTKSIGNWGLSDAKSKEAYDEIKPYLNITKECIGSEGCWTKDVKNLNGQPAVNFTNQGFGSPAISFKTADGMNVSFDITGESFNVSRSIANTIIFVVDVNGDRNPNRLGKDVFFFVMGDKWLLPSGDNVSGTGNCVATDSGRDCAAVVIRKDY